METSDWGDRVLLTANDKIIRIFRSKRVFTSNRIWPYAKRFARNAKRLTELGVATIMVRDVYKCPAENGHLVIYDRLPGETLRRLKKVDELADETIIKLATFIGELHGKGIYFRALHFGNILLINKGGFALIDIDFMKFTHASLTVSRRIKNFLNFLRYADDRKIVGQVGLDTFINRYLDDAQLSGDNAKRFTNRVLKNNRV